MPTLKSLLQSKPPLIWPQPASKKATAVKKQILELEFTPLPTLRRIWKERYGEPVPAPSSKTLLFRILAWRIQADEFGGHSPAVLRILNERGNRQRNAKGEAGTGDSLSVGTLLKRDWGGRTHHVAVTKEGFGHEGKTYKTLSEAARAITGTKWSGPRFFGLKDAKGKPRSIGNE